MVRETLEKLVKGELDLAEAERALRMHALEDVEGSVLDIGRDLRTGVPEAVLGRGKDVESFVEAAVSMAESRGRCLATRVSEEQLEALRMEAEGVEWHPAAGAAVIDEDPPSVEGLVGILTGGTSDGPAAEEARVTAEFMGCETLESYDVGVAGIHRLLPPLKEMLGEVDVLVVAAGREGALPSVVAGLADVPVIGLPTSNGYGFGGDGEAALMGMLQSCSVLSAVNIDAGFIAGAFAAQVARG